MWTKTVIATLFFALLQSTSSRFVSNEDCSTRKTIDGRCCVFPFVYKGREYNDCKALRDGREWCFVTENYDKDRQFGFCDKSAAIFDKIEKINNNDRIANIDIGDGVELFQGDIVMTQDLKTDLIRKGIITGRRRRVRAVNRNRDSRWIGADGRPEVPYRIENSNNHARGVIEQAMRHWVSKVPCMRFVQHTNQRNYLSFFAGGGCYSAVGRGSRSGPQRVSIGRGCESMGVVAHEIGHALGFWHEQSRPDRDNYVRIHWENIRRGMEYNFRKYSDSTINSMKVPYDYVSLMHYGSRAFSINGRNTITRIDGGTKLGQRSGLSDRDAQQANLFYCGNAPKPSGCQYTDRYTLCPNWQRFGHCTSLYKDFMMRFCEKSCKCPA